MSNTPTPTHVDEQPLLLTPREVSALLGVPLSKLRRWRRQHTGPAYHQLGRNLIRYPTTAIQAHQNPTNTR